MQPIVNDIGNRVAVITEFAAAQGMTVVHATTVSLSLNLGPGGGDQADLSQACERIGVAPAQVTQVTWAGATTTGAGCSVPTASLILSS